jgi:hypothetical protein
MAIKRPRLIVKPHRPGRQLIMGIVAASVLGVAAWMAFEYGQWQKIYARMTALAHSQSTEAAEESIEKLKTENTDLLQRITILERAAQIDKEADLRLQAHIRELQDQTYELKEELEFYRKVVATAKEDSGLRIQGLRVEPLSEAGRFRYELVLTNLGKDDKVTAGDATIEVAGRRQGSPQKFQITTSKDGSRTTTLAFSFVHFHRLEGDFTVPDDFEPESVRVVIRQGSVKEPRHDASYEWNELVQAKG